MDVALSRSYTRLARVLVQSLFVAHGGPPQCGNNISDVRFGTDLSHSCGPTIF